MRLFPGFDSVFLVRDPLSRQFYRGGFKTTLSYLEILAVLRGEAQLHAPIIIPHGMGGAEPLEVVWTGMGTPIILHESVIKVLRKFTGWCTYPVEVLNRAEERKQGYFGLTVTGRCGPIEWGRSERVRNDDGTVSFFRGRYFDPATWDGSDIFMESPDEKGHAGAFIWVTDEVHQALSREGVRNLVFEPSTEAEMSASSIRINSPHRLPLDIY